MSNKSKLIFKLLFIISPLIIIFDEWFSNRLITAGDFWPLYTSQFSNYTFLPHAWNVQLNNGLGGDTILFLWNYFLFNFPIYFLGQVLGLSYPLVERIGFLFPLLILGIISMYVWTLEFFKSNIPLRFISGLIYLTNTYILLIIGGGQMGIIFGYLFAPFIFLYAIKIVNTIVASSNSASYAFSRQLFSRSICVGVLFSIEIGFDLRSFYIVLCGIGIYIFIVSIINFIQNKHVNFRIFDIGLLLTYTFFIPLLTAAFVHAFWILPLLIQGISSTSEIFGEAYTTVKAVDFLSFAAFPNSFSLLHPNWPENIFGKTYFMRPEFIGIPIIAYSSLLFINGHINSLIKNRKQFVIDNSLLRHNTIIFFAVLGLIGVFLAKGSNEPFGELYVWMFNYIPGFKMFRDPTKWYLLIALSYSVLIPHSIYYMYNIIKRRKNIAHLLQVLATTFLIYWFVIILYVFINNLHGIYKSTQIPKDYSILASQIAVDKSFYRTLWVPRLQRFAFYSHNHPAVDATLFFKAKSVNDLVSLLKNKNAKFDKPYELLQEIGIKYIVVSYDSEKEIYLLYREYDDTIEQRIVKELDTISWLKKRMIGKIAIFEVEGYKDRIRIEGQGSENLDYTPINPTKYNLKVNDISKPVQVIFSENYSSNWVLRTLSESIVSRKYSNVNSFVVSRGGEYTLEYKTERILQAGILISVMSIVAIVFILLKFFFRK